MTVGVSVKTVEPTPTAVVAAVVTWAEFPALWMGGSVVVADGAVTR